MIKPINGHVLIEPLKHESFIASQRDTYEEVGIVLEVDNTPKGNTSYYVSSGAFGSPVGSTGSATPLFPTNDVKKGDKVYFDAWLAVKYPDGKDGFFWLVKEEDIRAIETDEDKVSE